MGCNQFDFQPIKVTFTGKDDNEKKKELMKIVHIAYNVMLEQLHTQEKTISKNSMKQIRSRLMDWVKNATLGAKNNNVKHFLYASTSSVYGLTDKKSFKEKDIADHPIQFYAATKRANEIIAHSYSHLFNLNLMLIS